MRQAHKDILESDDIEDDMERFPIREQLKRDIQKLIKQGHIIPADDSRLADSAKTS